MTVLTAVIRLYPRAWRQRYGAEMQELIAAQGLSMRTLADLVAGAVDAHLSPQLEPASRAGHAEGADTMVRRFHCAAGGVSVHDQWRSAAWMIGGSLLLTVVSVGLHLQLGRNALSESLLYSAFPASLMLSSECTYLRRYSPRARAVMASGGAALVVLFVWAAVAIGDRI